MVGHALRCRFRGVAFHSGLFIWNVESWKPETFFGRYSDDALYFSTAQALAQHQGYILPSFPGRPLRQRSGGFVSRHSVRKFL
jgi:hypothetical protein